jgi:hypothetical protein
MTTTSTDPRRLTAPATLFVALRQAAVAGRDPTHAASLLRQAGYDAGAGFMGLLADSLVADAAGSRVSDLPAPVFWKEFGALWEALGWGTLTHTQLHEAVVALDAEDWAEAVADDGLGCQVTTGLLADLLRRIADEDVAVLEISCRSRGEPACRFLVGGPATLQSVYDALRRGDSLEVALAALG